VQSFSNVRRNEGAVNLYLSPFLFCSSGCLCFNQFKKRTVILVFKGILIKYLNNHQGNTKKKGESQVPFIRLTVVMEIMTMANNEIEAFPFLFKRALCKTRSLTRNWKSLTVKAV